MNFPLPILQAVSAAHPWTYLVFLAIGIGFGYVLESSGFGNSKKLAAQFYFTEMTVLKVMFGAIVTAMVLLFSMIGLGILDYSQVWVNPTYLSSGIVGGLIMGVGFIVGGFCPGTSLVAIATRKIDGLFFVVGGLFGIFLFGETEHFYDQWWNFSGYLGRLTIMDWLKLPTGVVVLIIVLMALFMFWGSEQLERIFGGRNLKIEPKLRYAGAAALIVLALFVIVLGDRTTEDKWTKISATKEALLAERQVQVHPGEVLATRANDTLKLVLLDVRPENEFNLFHIQGATNVPLSKVPSILPELHAQQALNTIFVVMSNDEGAATEAWKIMVAESIPNTYILEGGVNNWIATFKPQVDDRIVPTPTPVAMDTLLEIKRDKSGGGCG
jgi:rhodanese-related sulfurtransferase